MNEMSVHGEAYAAIGAAVDKIIVEASFAAAPNKRLFESPYSAIENRARNTVDALLTASLIAKISAHKLIVSFSTRAVGQTWPHANRRPTLDEVVELEQCISYNKPNEAGKRVREHRLFQTLAETNKELSEEASEVFVSHPQIPYRKFVDMDALNHMETARFKTNEIWTGESRLQVQKKVTRIFVNNTIMNNNNL